MALVSLSQLGLGGMGLPGDPRCFAAAKVMFFAVTNALKLISYAVIGGVRFR
ncbi:MAG: hypothetical protein Q4G14_01620 [Paracoccus sp. (in: a-proteobacteria)]|nr:hypothetical protein [Paracoccus sp. (in: a-proteobacteria)]